MPALLILKILIKILRPPVIPVINHLLFRLGVDPDPPDVLGPSRLAPSFVKLDCNSI
jgi:hypothetical protein